MRYEKTVLVNVRHVIWHNGHKLIVDVYFDSNGEERTRRVFLHKDGGRDGTLTEDFNSFIDKHIPIVSLAVGKNKNGQ